MIFGRHTDSVPRNSELFSSISNDDRFKQSYFLLAGIGSLKQFPRESGNKAENMS